MPSGKQRKLDDTWKESELAKSVKEARDGKKSRDRDRDKDKKKERHRDEDDRKKERKHRSEDDREHRKDRERRHRDKENGDVERRDKSRSKRTEKSERKPEKSEKTSKSKEEREKRPRRPKDEQQNGDDDDRERRHRKDKERRHDEDRKHRSSKDKDGERSHKSSRHKDEDDDRERRHRKHKDRDENEDREKRHRKRDGDENDDRERRRKHRDEDDDRERKHRKDKDEEDDEERQRRREERRKRHEEKKRKEEEEKRQRELEEQKKKQEEDEYDYDDDFEDYEDDFEDDDGDDDKKRYDDSDDGDRRKYSSDDDSDYDRKKKEKPKKSANEMDEIMQAMNEENERLISESRRKDWPQEESDDDRYNSRSSRDKAPPGGRTFINFVSAKQRVITDQASNKTRRRGRELLNIIELDVAKFDIFDLPPVHEYNLYMRAFGSSNTKQAYIQTNDDNIERDIQTEPIEYTEKWSQHPPEDFNCCGGTDDNNKDELDSKPVDTAGLYKFIKRAGQTVLTLLEEDLAERMQADQSRKQSNIIVSEAYVELGQVNMLKGRHVLYSYFSPTQTHLLLTVYSQSTEPGEHAKKGLICVWNVNEPSQPQKYLLCESQPHCCCFSPSKATIAFAGTSDGSVLAWDLREPSSIHRQHRDTGEVLRFPTYNTAGVLQYENHISPVISMHPVVAPDSGGGSALEGGDAGDSQSFQLATLEENSVINLWVVAEITNPDRAGSASDLGLAPGGRVKLIKSSSVILESPLRNKRLKTTVQSFDMQLLPSNNSHFYVTTNTGCVIHGVRYGGKSHPKAYYPTDNAMVTVTSLDFSPFSEPVFLIGCDDGTIRLHHTNSEHPLITWSDTTEGRCIQCIRWCRSRPSVFFVLDDSSQLYIWDLQMSDAVPMKVERIAKDRVTNFNLSNDHSATGSGLPGRKPQMLVGLENGASEVHTVSREFSALMGEEVDTFAAFIKSNA